MPSLAIYHSPLFPRVHFYFHVIYACMVLCIYIKSKIHKGQKMCYLSETDLIVLKRHHFILLYG